MTTATLTQLFERVSSSNPKVNRSAGVIRGVKILGKSSLNNREYSARAMQSAAKLYENMKVCIGHPPRSDATRERNVGENIGWLENCKVRDGAVYGDLHVLKSHSLANQVFETAERNPRQMGLSHNAEGPTDWRNGRTIVEDIERVHSVDLVLNPATNRGLFESSDDDDDDRIPPEPFSEASTPIDVCRQFTYTAEYAAAALVRLVSRSDSSPKETGQIVTAIEQWKEKLLSNLEALKSKLPSDRLRVDDEDKYRTDREPSMESFRQNWNRAVANGPSRQHPAKPRPLTGASFFEADSDDVPFTDRWDRMLSKSRE